MERNINEEREAAMRLFLKEEYDQDGPGINICLRCYEDFTTLALAWIDDHPSDDSEPITREWLDAAFPERNSAWWYLDDTLRMVLILDDIGHADIWVSNGQFILADADHEVLLRTVTTRGDVRAFLRGMGIESKGGN